MNTGISISKHLVTLLIFYEKMMFCTEGYQLMGSCFCHGSAVT